MLYTAADNKVPLRRSKAKMLYMCPFLIPTRQPFYIDVVKENENHSLFIRNGGKTKPVGYVMRSFLCLVINLLFSISILICVGLSIFRLDRGNVPCALNNHFQEAVSQTSV